MSEPIAYTALAKGADVSTSDGERLGTVEHVLQVPSLDLFDGLVVRVDEHTGVHGLRFVDANRVTGITTDGVATSITASDVATLPAPQGDEVLDADPEQYEGAKLTAWWGRTFRRSHWMREED